MDLNLFMCGGHFWQNNLYFLYLFIFKSFSWVWKHVCLVGKHRMSQPHNKTEISQKRKSRRNKRISIKSYLRLIQFFRYKYKLVITINKIKINGNYHFCNTYLAQLQINFMDTSSVGFFRPLIGDVKLFEFFVVLIFFIYTGMKILQLINLLGIFFMSQLTSSLVLIERKILGPQNL